jgi:FO synthase
MDDTIVRIGRRPEQRTTLYKPVPPARRQASYGCAPLTSVVQTPASRQGRLTSHALAAAHS